VFGFLMRDYLSLWLLIPVIAVVVIVIIYDRSYVFTLLICFVIASIGFVKKAKSILPDDVFEVGRVLSNSQSKFRFITVRKPKKIFEIRKSNYKDGSLYVGDFVFWDKGFDAISAPKKLEGFIYADYLRDIEVDGIVKLSGFPSKVGPERLSVFKLATQFKNLIVTQLLQVKQLSENSRGVLIALLTGDRSFLSKSTKELFREAGVVHVLAISGMHVGVLYLLFVFIFKKVLRLKGKTALFLIVIGIVFYAFLSGLSPSVVRATIMLLLIQFGSLLNSNVKTLNLVISAGWIMLVYEPFWIYDIGFQLSFSAVIGILIFLNRFKNCGITGRLSVLTDLLKVNTGAFLFTVPILSYHFQLINFTSWWASFIIVPFISILMYAGILGLIVMRVSVLKSLVFQGVNYFIQFVEFIVSFVIQFSSLQLYWQCSFFELLFYYCLLFSLLFSKKILFFSAVILLMLSVFIKPTKEVRLLNCKRSIQIKHDNACFSLGDGDIFQLNKYFFSVKKRDENTFKVFVYEGFNGFSNRHVLTHSLTVDKYHIIRLEY
jgi:ComEC/Rec2-related protein